MKRIFVPAACLLGILLLVPNSIFAVGVPFFSVSVEEGKAIAAREDKLLFVSFTASWCMPCQWLERNTFQDYNLSRFVERNVVSVKLDVDDFQGFKEKEAYEIEQLPSFLIFNTSGQLLTKVEKTLSANELLDLLQKYNTPRYKFESDLAISPAAGALSTGMAHLNKPTLGAAQDQLAPEKIYMPVPEPTILAGASTRPNYANQHHYVSSSYNQENTYSSTPDIVQPKSQIKEFYGVQVGIFSNYENAIPFITKLEGKVNTKADLFRNDHDYQKTIFKVVVGKFESEEQAIRFQKALAVKGFKGNVKNLSEL